MLFRSSPTKFTKSRYFEKFKELLPSDEKITNILKEAHDAPTPANISWKDKHRYVETVLHMKGYVKQKDETKSQVNVGIFIENTPN